MQTPHIFTCLKLLIDGFEKVRIAWTINKLCYDSLKKSLGGKKGKQVKIVANPMRGLL